MVVNEAPLLQEGVDTHDGADITGEVATASGDGQVFDGVQSICVDHEITVVLVDGGGLASIPAVEELCESLSLDGVDGVHVKPRGVAGEDDGMGLRHEMIACRRFDGCLLCGLFLRRALCTGLSGGFGVVFAFFLRLRLRTAHLLIFRVPLRILRLGGSRGI